uniref:Putative secreted protein n=1 Tax=Xenopsylla cheopis TaxID=163159 RepID=A0A6M2E0A0_XENCH
MKTVMKILVVLTLFVIIKDLRPSQIVQHIIPPIHEVEEVVPAGVEVMEMMKMKEMKSYVAVAKNLLENKL